MASECMATQPSQHHANARAIAFMSDLTDLYQEVILDHNRRPRNFGVLRGPIAQRARATIRSAATG